MSKLLKVLTDEHQIALKKIARTRDVLISAEQGQVELAELIKALKGYSDFLKFAIEDHFANEEKYLFPFFYGYDGLRLESDQVIDLMNREHLDLDATNRELVAELAKENPDQERLIELGRYVTEVLAGHIEQEDEVLFPEMSDVLSAEQKKEMDRLWGK